MDNITFVEIILTIIVVSTQIRSFLLTRRYSGTLTSLFPYCEPIARIRSRAPEPLSETETGADHPRIEPNGSTSGEFDQILAATNRYLEKNVGTPADFRILQDIAERVSDSAEHLATSNASLPLYIGLMGTFIGVIVGLVTIAIEPASTISDSDLKRFLGGVLVAMTGSLCGLLLTVIGKSLYVHRALNKNDNRKQVYFTFLETELLPVVGHDVSAALHSLQLNLHQFNADFKSNLTLFSTAMGGAAATMEQERELLKTIQSAQFTKVIETNITMLAKSQTIAAALTSFVETFNEFENRLADSGELADKLTSLLNRVTVFETSVNGLGEKLAVDHTVTMRTVQLIQAQLEAIKSRNELITQYADARDEEVRLFITDQRKKLNELTERASQQLSDVTDELARSITKALGEKETSELLEQVSRLKDIDDHIQGLEREVRQWHRSNSDREIIRILEGIAATAKSNGHLGGSVKPSIWRFFRRDPQEKAKARGATK
jgi:hypothetical protein